MSNTRALRVENPNLGGGAESKKASHTRSATLRLTIYGELDKHLEAPRNGSLRIASYCTRPLETKILEESPTSPFSDSRFCDAPEPTSHFHTGRSIFTSQEV